MINQLQKQITLILVTLCYQLNITQAKQNQKKKIPDTSGLVEKTKYNTKITELENKIRDISNLATKTALTAIENKMPDTSNLVKKSDFNTNITNIENNVRQLQAYDSSYFKGKQYFDEGTGKQSYLVFLPLSKYFKLNSVAGVSDYVLSW